MLPLTTAPQREKDMQGQFTVPALDDSHNRRKHIGGHGGVYAAARWPVAGDPFAVGATR